MALSDYSPAQEPVAYGAAVTAVVALAAQLFRLDPGVETGIITAVLAVIGVLVRRNVTPAANLPQSGAQVPEPLAPTSYPPLDGKTPEG